jgi:hypothetical protein
MHGKEAGLPGNKTGEIEHSIQKSDAVKKLDVLFGICVFRCSIMDNLRKEKSGTVRSGTPVRTILFCPELSFPPVSSHLSNRLSVSTSVLSAPTLFSAVATRYHKLAWEGFSCGRGLWRSVRVSYQRRLAPALCSIVWVYLGYTSSSQ